MTGRLGITLGPADQGKYERGTEQFIFDEAMLAEVDCEFLESVEEELDTSLVDLLSQAEIRRSVKDLRRVTWIARRLAGITESYTEFTPNVFACRYERRPDPTHARDSGPTPVTTANDSVS